MKKLLALALALLAVLLPAAGCPALAEEAGSGRFVFVSGPPDPGAETGTGAGFVPNLPVAMTDSSVFTGRPEVNGAIFGGDDREIIYVPDLFPYVAVAYMDIDFACGCGATGTGFMAERNKLITAAHCIVCTDHGAWADHIDFYFGYVSSRSWYYKYSGRWYAIVGNTFPDGYTTDADWAVVKFYENVGDTVGWFGYHFDIPDSEIAGKQLNLLGYRSGILRLSSGTASKGYGSLLNHKMDMEAGNSGGPIFYMEGDTPYAIAINIADNEESNYSYRLTNEIFSYFMELDNR